MAKGDVLIQLEYYHDLDPNHPTAFTRFERRRQTLPQEYNQWATIGADSMTSYIECALNQGRHVSRFKHDMQSYRLASMNAREILMTMFGSMPGNCFVVCHVSDYVKDIVGPDGNVTSTRVIKEIMLPGQLPGVVPSGFGEVYRAYDGPPEAVITNGIVQTHSSFLLQVERNDGWDACTQLYPPKGLKVTAGTWEQLWTAENAHMRAFPVHLLIYGKAGTMKSTLCAGMPKPMLGFIFDGRQKEWPYLRQGQPTQLYQNADGTMCQQVLEA